MSLHVWKNCESSTPGRVDVDAPHIYPSKCGVGTCHFHCSSCGLVAFPGDDGLEYVAWERDGQREWDVVPKVCPLPSHLRPFKAKREKVEPFTVGKRWSLFWVFEGWAQANAWFYECARVLGATDLGKEPIAALKPFRSAYAVFVRVERNRLSSLVERIMDDVEKDRW